MVRYCLLAILFLAGCVCNPDLKFKRPYSTGDEWNTTRLIDADPSKISLAYLADHAEAVDFHYWKYAQVNGITWPPWRTSGALKYPDRWINGGDSALFTGYALAAYVFKYRTTKQASDLISALETLRGLYILTHATGTPGVICRSAFPADKKNKWNYPREWQHRIDKGFARQGPATLDDPIYSGGQLPSSIYYTRGTRDQLTGIVFGLSVAWALLEKGLVEAGDRPIAAKMRNTIADITEALYNYLVKFNWRIKDERGKNDTSADLVRGLTKVALLALYSQTVNASLVGGNLNKLTEIRALYEKEFDAFIDLSNTLAYSDRFNNLDGYFGHNLRTARAFGIWLLEKDPVRKIHMRSYIAINIWPFVKGHQNAWFAFVRAVVQRGDFVARREGVLALKSLAVKPLRLWSSPYHDQEQKPGIAAVAAGCTAKWALPPHLRKPTGYFTWQKEPWDVGETSDKDFDKEGLGDATGVDFLLVYWVAKYYKLL